VVINIRARASFILDLLIVFLRDGISAAQAASVMVFILRFMFMGFALCHAVRLALELHLHDRQCGGIELHFDVPAGGIPADDLVTAVIDPDAAQLPSLPGGKPFNGGPGLPPGHRHFAAVFGMRGGGAEHPEKQEPC
jgi:hypothetical protein